MIESETMPPHSVAVFSFNTNQAEGAIREVQPSIDIFQSVSAFRTHHKQDNP